MTKEQALTDYIVRLENVAKAAKELLVLRKRADESWLEYTDRIYSLYQAETGNPRPDEWTSVGSMPSVTPEERAHDIMNTFRDHDAWANGKQAILEAELDSLAMAEYKNGGAE